MRLFASVDLDGLAEEVDAVQEPLRGLPGLNPVDPGQAHVTVKFLGEGDHDLDALSEALETAVEDADVGPFDVEFEGYGVFPSLEYISVVWLGVGDGSEELTALHDAVEAETTALGYDPEGHDFTPHVTLARMDHAAAKGDVQRLVREEAPTAGRMRVEALRLTESSLTSEGPEYRTVERFEL